jgi:hypothetical protein
VTTVFPFPLQPITARRQLRQAVVAALGRANLVVGTTSASVDSPGDWPYPQQKLPAVCVRSSLETKAAVGKKAPDFTTTAELDVRAATFATTGEAAQDALEALWYQVEQAILTDFYVLQLVQSIPTIESAFEIKADAQGHIAGAIGRFRFETFETFDISQSTGGVIVPSVADPIVPLDTVTVDLTRQGSDPPFSPQPDDLGLTLNLSGD